METLGEVLCRKRKKCEDGRRWNSIQCDSFRLSILQRLDVVPGLPYLNLQHYLLQSTHTASSLSISLATIFQLLRRVAKFSPGRTKINYRQKDI